MYCSNCGKPNPDGNRFCASCGAPLEGSPSMEGKRPDMSAGRSGPARSARGTKAAGETACLTAIRELGTSKMYLTAAVSMTASIVAGILYAASSASQGYLNYIYLLLSQLGSSEEAYEIRKLIDQYARAARGAGFFSALVSSIPAILTALAVWLIYAEAKKEPGRAFSTTGFTILRVFATIGFVGLVLVAAGILIMALVIFGASGQSSGGNRQEAVAAGLIIILVFGIILAFPMVYFWKLMRMLKETGKMALGGPPVRCASSYVGVITMFGAVGGLGILAMADGLGRLSGLASCTASVCFSLLIFKFKERLELILASDEGAEFETDHVDYGMDFNSEPPEPENRLVFGEGSGRASYNAYGVDPEYGGEKVIDYNAGKEADSFHSGQNRSMRSQSGLAQDSPYDYSGAYGRGISPASPAPAAYSGETPGAASGWNSYGPRPGMDDRDPDGTIVESYPEMASGSEKGYERHSHSAYPNESFQQNQNEQSWNDQSWNGQNWNGQNRNGQNRNEQSWNGNNAPAGPSDTWIDDRPYSQSGQPLQGSLAAAYENPSVSGNEDPFTAREKPRIPGMFADESHSPVPEQVEAEVFEKEREEQGRLAREEEERLEHERLAREEQERQERERIVREEEERRIREEQERLAREEKERRVREEQERQERERLAHEEERRIREEQERQERERRAREEEERRLREEQERQEQERLAREEEERRIREEQERLAREEEERRIREEQERKEQEHLAAEAEKNRKAGEAQNILLEGKKSTPATEAFYNTSALHTTPLTQPQATLTRHKDHNRVSIKNPLLRIGRNPRDVDYVIWNNPTIGRHHADIVFKDGHYYIFDNNSTNHVFLNGVMVPPCQDIPLPDEAVIRLSDEEFSFKIW